MQSDLSNGLDLRAEEFSGPKQVVAMRNILDVSATLQEE
jgi:hypothetical protein